MSAGARIVSLDGIRFSLGDELMSRVDHAAPACDVQTPVYGCFTERSKGFSSPQDLFPHHVVGR
jgi:hypothetical protein